MTDLNLNPLNARLAVFGLPLLTEAGLDTLPVSLTRIEHALGQAERGRPGAQIFLSKHLRNAVSAPSASVRPASPALGTRCNNPTGINGPGGIQPCNNPTGINGPGGIQTRNSPTGINGPGGIQPRNNPTGINGPGGIQPRNSPTGVCR